ncbi:MAG: MarR family transcriptional regulator [Patescibacteria group bacterium]|nr:MarR family transcriptional regulator [Patescibacteria group bacterium]
MLRTTYKPAPTYQIGLMKSQIYRSMNGYLTKALVPYNITPPEWMLIGSIYENGQILPTELSQNLGVKPPVVTSSLKSLQDKKIIHKERSTRDGRYARVSLTLKGKQIVAEAEAVMQQDLKAFLHGIKPADLKVYNRVLMAIFTKISNVAA